MLDFFIFVKKYFLMRRIILLGLSAFPVLGYSQTEEEEPKEKQIEEVVFQKKAKSTDLTNVQISSEEVRRRLRFRGEWKPC